MACKKSELVSAINSFAAARSTQDANLMGMSGQMLQQMVDSLAFAPEEEPAEDKAES